MALSSMLMFTLIYVFSGPVSSELVLEEGYTVSTVLDGNKLHINPYSVLPRLGTHDLIILDSSASILYTVLSFPISQEHEINRFAGNGSVGFSDGESKCAMFKHPQSFTVDTRGNVYIADRRNHAIRKISKSGVSTIAGGYSKGPGNTDGPAQNASFSESFDLAFVPQICALLISDRGNRLIRRINLKPEDCAKGSQLDHGLAWIWFVMGLGVLGILVLLSPTRSLWPQLFQWNMEAIPNRSGKTSCDGANNHELIKEQIFVDHLKDLITFYGCLDAERVEGSKQGAEDHKGTRIFTDSYGEVNAMRRANIMDFSNWGDQATLVGCLVGSRQSSGSVNRKLKLD